MGVAPPILFAEAPPVPASAGVGSVARLGANFARELASDEAVNPFASQWIYNLEGDPHPSKILQTKSKPDQLLGELYTHMLDSDSDLSGLVEKRVDVVLSVPRRIVPRDGSPAALETAAFCRAALATVPGFAMNLRHQLMGKFLGVAFDELRVERLPRGPLAGAWVPVDLKDRPMHRFGFRDWALHRRMATAKLEPLPEAKFLVFRWGTKDSPWGKPFLDELYWPWWLKKNGLKFWSIFLDKWGMPTGIGKYRHGTDEKTNQENQGKLLQVLQQIQSQYGIVLPEGLDVSLLEAQRSGSVSYEQFQSILTRTMALKILGEVDTSGAAKGPGSFAKSDVSNSVRLEKAALDAHDFGAHLTETLLARLVAWNFGPDWPVPVMQVDTVDADDRDQRSTGIEKTLALGLPVSERYVRMTHRAPAPEPGEPAVEAKPAAAPTTPPPAVPPVPTKPALKASADASASRGARDLAPRIVLAEGDDERRALASAARRLTDFDAVGRHFAERSVAYYATWRDELLAAFDAGDVASGRALRRLAGAINPLEQARAVQTAMVHGMGLSLQHLAEDVGSSSLRLALPQGWQQAGDPESALDYWMTQLQLPKDAFLGLDDAARRAAFTVAGVSDLETLAVIHALVGEAINGGWTRQRFADALDAVLAARGLDPIARWHAELIYANATRTAANLLRFQQLVLNPQARRLTPYLTWWSLDDGKVRPEHVLMHGHTAATDHPIWRTWWPPAGHNCRCYIGTVSLPEARRRGLVGAEPMGPWPTFEGQQVMPDPGFAGVLTMTRVADDMTRRAEDVVTQARAEGSPDFLEAILQLFAQLFGALLGGEPESVDFAAFVAAAADRKVA